MEEKENCPKCHEIGEKVKNITVKHMVSENLMGKVVDEETYYLCMNEDCDAVYYNLNNEKVFYKEDVKVPIWLKKNANPKYICYCNQVTEQQIINAVLYDGVKNIKDIIRLTGSMGWPKRRDALLLTPSQIRMKNLAKIQEKNLQNR